MNFEMTSSTGSAKGSKSAHRNSASFTNSQIRPNSESSSSPLWWSRPSPSKSSRLSSSNVMSKSFSGAEPSARTKLYYGMTNRNARSGSRLIQNPPLAASVAARQESSETWGSSVFRKIRSLWSGGSSSSLNFNQIDKEDLIDPRRPPPVMTTSTPNNFDCEPHDTYQQLPCREGSNTSWGGSLQRKFANLSKSRQQQDDSMSLASVEAMDTKSTNSPYSTMKKSTDSCHLDPSSSESMFSGGLAQHRLSYAGFYPSSSDDSHTMDRHYGSIRRSVRKEKAAAAQKAPAKSSSALTSSLMHSSTPLLRPLFFEVPQLEPEPPFIGRHWLFKQILNGVMTEKGAGYLLIGNQGAGKTAFLLQLVEQSCFGRGHVMHPDEQLNNLRCDEMFTLAQMVVGYHFCQADNSITCYVPEFVHSLAAQLYQAPQMEAYRQQLNSESHLQQLVSIEECIADPDRALTRGILEPLTFLAQHDRIPSSMPCLILIDALGEAEYHRPDYTSALIAFLVKHLSSFPPWLKIIATVQTPLQKLTSQLPFQRISLDRTHANESLQRDMLEYIKFRIKSSPKIQSSISSPSSSLTNSMNGSFTGSINTHFDHVHSKFAQHLNNLAQGSFLFTKMTLDLMDAGHLVSKAAGYRVLPTTLHQLFLLKCNLRFTSESSFSKVEPLLAVCLASLHPLNLIEIYHSATSLQNEPDNWDTFAEKFSMLEGMLVKRTDDTYMFFHPSFREWLIKGGGNDENKFVCDLKKGHAGIALRFCRVQQPLTAELTLELSHHILKAHIFKNAPNMPKCLTSRDMQAQWLLSASEAVTDSLCCARNVFSPNVKVSRLLLLSGANANAQTEALGGVPILCAAAHLGFLEFVSSLLDFGAQPRLTDAKGATPLILAAAAGHQGVCSVLLKAPGADTLVGVADDSGRCPLVHAASGGHLEIVKQILAFPWASAKVESTFQIGTPCGREETVLIEKTGLDKTQAKHQALVAAAAKGQTEVVLCILEDRSVPIDIPDTLHGETALTAAAAGGHVATCQALLQKSASVMVPNTKGLMPLCVSVKEGHWPTAEIFLQKGVPVDQADYHGRTALMYAALEGHLAIVQLLVQNCASIHRADKEGVTALCHACHKGRVQVAKFLIDNGADLNQTDKSGRTPLDAATSQCNPEILELLLENNVAVDRTDVNGLRPLEKAILSGNIAVVQCFLKKKPSLSSATWQAAQGKPDMLLMLLQRLLEDGNLLYKRGRHQDAANRFYYAIKKLPPTSAQNSCEPFLLLHLQLLLNLSRCNLKLNNCEEAVQLAEMAMRIRPDSFEALFARARALLVLGELKCAQDDVNQALALVPQHNRTARKVILKLREDIEFQIQNTLD
ncbi:protein TANC2 isoform X2 [Neocloeon triangulifer]|nr:protein TANC2 isoform X2 [Neocloeon triangulifer]XP_059471681.1 protein TANC2 isoform X2 [Neocloeon triangulifer]XP_059471683.1 protein TANC2 isoform X2 [Neocloeon triangulifer]